MTRVAIQGIKGSYSEEAAIRLLGDAIELIECPTFEAAFREAERDGTLAVIPVRNTIVGRIESTAELLSKSGLVVRDEFVLGIEHVLAWCAEYGIHVDPDRNFTPGSSKTMQRFFCGKPAHYHGCRQRHCLEHS